jgi:hypothetical protein
MRWTIGHILTVQEHLTKYVDKNGTGTAGELQAVGWLEFCKKYDSTSGSDSASGSNSASGSEGSPALRDIFDEYEADYERIIHRRYAQLGRKTPRNIEDFNKEEKKLRWEKELYPNINPFPPDHRVRRLQHLLIDLVVLLDKFTATRLNRPVRKCDMTLKRTVYSSHNPLSLETGFRIPCDCSDTKKCNKDAVDFEHRQLPRKNGKNWLLYCTPEATQEEQEDASLENKNIVERSNV